MKEYAFGVDVGGTSIKMGFFRIDGTLLESWEIETNTGNNGNRILPEIAEAICKKIKASGIQRQEVEGIGIGVPGPVDESGIVNGCVNLGWGKVDVSKELCRMTEGIPVRVGNDANLAALGEAWMGAGQSCRNMVMVTLGTGVGGGIIAEGRIINGYHGAGGEIGHLTVDDHETELCNCGKKGCLEQYASAGGIVSLARKELAESSEDSALRGMDEITAKIVFDEAQNGDALAQKAVEKACDKLGAALANISAVADPQMIVIGGGVSKAGKFLLDLVHEAFLKKCFHASASTAFSLAKLGNDAGIYGGVRLLL